MRQRRYTLRGVGQRVRENQILDAVRIEIFAKFGKRHGTSSVEWRTLRGQLRDYFFASLMVCRTWKKFCARDHPLRLIAPEGLLGASEHYWNATDLRACP